MNSRLDGGRVLLQKRHGNRHFREGLDERPRLSLQHLIFQRKGGALHPPDDVEVRMAPSNSTDTSRRMHVVQYTLACCLSGLG